MNVPQACAVPSRQQQFIKGWLRVTRAPGRAVVAQQGTERAQWGARGQSAEGEKSLAGVSASGVDVSVRQGHSSFSLMPEFLPPEVRPAVQRGVRATQLSV